MNRIKRIEADYDDYNHLYNVVLHVDNNGEKFTLNNHVCPHGVWEYKNMMINRYGMENTYKTKELAFLLALEKFLYLLDVAFLGIDFDDLQLDIKDLDFRIR